MQSAHFLLSRVTERCGFFSPALGNFGALSGNGVGGAGTKFLEGDARPGASPGIMAFGGDVVMGPFSTTEIEIAGTTAGSEYDQITVANNLTLDGTLAVSLLN